MSKTKQLAIVQIILDILLIISLVVLLVNVISDGNQTASWITPLVFFAIFLIIGFIIGIFQILYSLESKESSPLGLAAGICVVLGLVFVSFVINIVILCTNIKFTDYKSVEEYSQPNTVVINQPTNNQQKVTVFIVHGIKFDSYIQAKEYCKDKKLPLSNITTKEKE